MSNKKGTEKELSCLVYPGMFKSERAVEITLPDGRTVSAFVDERDVRASSQPTLAGTVAGSVKVSVVEDKGESVIVDLPQPTLTNGTRFEVRKAELK